MNIAIIILVGLAIFVTGSLTINGRKFNVNWLALIAFILLLVQIFIK